MNAIERVQDILSHVTYKPGWKITAAWINDHFHRSYGLDNIILTVSRLEKDVTDPEHNKIVISNTKVLDKWDVDQMEDKAIIDHWIRGLIVDAEMHELDEWLRFDGIPIREPHPQEDIPWAK